VRQRASRARTGAAVAAGTVACLAALAACPAAALPAADQAQSLRAGSAARSANWLDACAAPAAATRLLVRRRGGFAAGAGAQGTGMQATGAQGTGAQGTGAQIAAAVWVTSVTAVRQVERALCQLPVRPPGTYHCPPDFGMSYSLSFWAGDLALPVVTVDPTGCQLVGGMPGPARWTALSPGFWRVLGSAVGLRHASIASFSGQPAGG
jgi:hypothetical protein